MQMLVKDFLQSLRREREQAAIIFAADCNLQKADFV
jgi:hypothetical protein